MSIKNILDKNMSFTRISIFENTTPLTIADGDTTTINIGDEIINQLSISKDGDNVIPSLKTVNEYVELSLEIEGIPTNQTSLYWTIEGVASPFNQVIDQVSTFKLGTNYLHLGGRIFNPDEWKDETVGFTFNLTNNGNHSIDISRLRTCFKSYYLSTK